MSETLDLDNCIRTLRNSRADRTAREADPKLTSPILSERIPALLRLHRKRKGLRLHELADRCNTTPQTIQRLETANMTVSLYWVDKILKALDLTFEDLLIKKDAKEIYAAAEQSIRERVSAEMRHVADAIEKGWK